MVCKLLILGRKQFHSDRLLVRGPRFAGIDRRYATEGRFPRVTLRRPLEPAEQTLGCLGESKGQCPGRGVLRHV